MSTATPPSSRRNVLARQNAGLFRERFGSPPTWMAAAPGRVNLIGEHVDYCQGLVLPMAVDRHVVVAASRGPDDQAIVLASTMPGTGEAVSLRLIAANCQTLVPDPALPRWALYVQGVMDLWMAAGKPSPGGLRVLVHADLPPGAGLSSSAALETAFATLLEAVAGVRMDPLEKALLCQRAERLYPGMPCGLMDQAACVMASTRHALLLDCQTLTTAAVPLPEDQVAVLILDTGVKHALAAPVPGTLEKTNESPYARRRRSCEAAAAKLGLPSLRQATLAQVEGSLDLDAEERRRARHVVTEIARVAQAAAALQAHDWPAFGELMLASHASLRDDFEVSCRELDAVVELCQELGDEEGWVGRIHGARMTGGGFGGEAVALVDPRHIDAISASLAKTYTKQGHPRPLTIFATPAVAGAGQVTW